MHAKFTWMMVLAVGSILTAPGSRAQVLVVTNPLAVDRGEEIVEVPVDEVLANLHIVNSQLVLLVAENAANKQRLPVQLYSDKKGAEPDTLLVLVSLAGKQSVRVIFRVAGGTPVQKPLVFGREAQERKDDYAWENEVVTYRVYGPALEATGEITSGIDVWSKRVPNLVIDSFYKRDAEGSRTHDPSLSYHKDNGVGLDSYSVGPTRGCGGTAVWSGGKLYPSNNYTAMQNLSSGPLRFAFELSYAPWEVDGKLVRETKRITLDAGSHLNKITSTFTFEGLAQLDVTAGIAIHEGADAKVLVAGSVASVWDTPQDITAGRIATGLVALPEEHAQTLTAAGHELLIFKRSSGEAFTYFAGSGWSKGDMPTEDAWNSYLKHFLELREHPLITRWAVR